MGILAATLQPASNELKKKPRLAVDKLGHRFPLSTPLGGDTRVAFGIMCAYCWHCGPE